MMRGRLPALALMIGIGLFAHRAHAQGILQTTYDKDAWPTQEASRTIVIPAGMLELQVGGGLQSHSSATDYSGGPMVAYGVTSNLTIGASQTTTYASFSDMGGLGISSDPQFGNGSVFVVARPFNDYDIGLRLDVPFVPDSPTLVLADPQLVGRVSLALDQTALLFATGVEFKAFSDDNVSFDTTFHGSADFVYQVNELTAISAGTDFGIGDHSLIDFHGKLQVAVGRGLDLFLRPGIQLGHHDGPLVSLGVTGWI